MPTDQIDQIDQIIDLIFEAKKLTQESHNRAFKGSPLHLQTLHFISTRPKTVMKDIADLFGITPPSVTSLVDGMVKAGLINRSMNANDRRVTELKVTPKGLKLLKTGFEYFKKQIRKALSSLNSDERSTLVRIIKKLADSRIN